MEEQYDESIPALEYSQHFNAALCQRLDRHFQGEVDAEGRGRRALVVGLFGEWGCGKTLHLQHLQAFFHQKLSAISKTSTPVRSITIPIFFNAWRYEAEEHLIIPLLKTTQYQLNHWYDKWAAQAEEEKSPANKSWGWLKEKAEAAADSAIALAYGFKGKLNVPFFGSMSFDPKAIIEEDKKRQQQRNQEEATYIDQLGSRYYDFESQISQLTGRANKDTPNLNLLFLVDDLDRCLPEKAVQMLESIKLFLDVEGCAFVMALDDEVIERGIAHRYRDYDPTRGQRGMESIAYSLRPQRYREFSIEFTANSNNPITGHEYLEKIVQLPVRIPAPTRSQVEDYLLKHFNHIFGVTGAVDGTQTE